MHGFFKFFCFVFDLGVGFSTLRIEEQILCVNSLFCS